MHLTAGWRQNLNEALNFVSRHEPTPYIRSPDTLACSRLSAVAREVACKRTRRKLNARELGKGAENAEISQIRLWFINYDVNS